MYCRLQCYPAPRLISYKIPGIRVLWGFGVTLSEVSTLAAQCPDLMHYGFSRTPPMQLTSKNGSMVVDFYPVKFATGEIHNRLMLKVVTFCGKTQSKSYINKKDFRREIHSRIEGYGYKVTNGELIPQLFNSAMVCAC